MGVEDELARYHKQRELAAGKFAQAMNSYSHGDFRQAGFHVLDALSFYEGMRQTLKDATEKSK